MKILSGAVAFAVLILFTFATSNAHQTINSHNSVVTSQTVQDSVKASKKKEETQKKKKSAKKENLGIGPVKTVDLSHLNKDMIEDGKNIFNSKCYACHRLHSNLVGPALVPIVQKKNPVYLMNYLLNTSEMQKKEPGLKKLVKEFHGVLMPDQNLSKKQAKSVLEYLTSVSKKKK